MNKYKIQFLCGQINYVHQFFLDYQDDKMTTVVEKLEKIKADIQVQTKLSEEEAIEHIKTIFAKSKYGPALHYAVQLKK